MGYDPDNLPDWKHVTDRANELMELVDLQADLWRRRAKHKLDLRQQIGRDGVRLRALAAAIAERQGRLDHQPGSSIDSPDHLQDRLDLDRDRREFDVLDKRRSALRATSDAEWVALEAERTGGGVKRADRINQLLRQLHSLRYGNGSPPNVTLTRRHQARLQQLASSQAAQADIGILDDPIRDPPPQPAVPTPVAQTPPATSTLATTPPPAAAQQAPRPAVQPTTPRRPPRRSGPTQ